MKIAGPSLSLAVLALAACSSSSTRATSSGGTSPDQGLAGNGNTAAAPETNPQGVAYPTDNIGTNPRSGDKRRHHYHEGTVMREFTAAARRAKLEKRATTHSLRHSFATPSARRWL